MRNSTLYCDVPVGLVVTGLVDPLGVPDMGECMMLIGTVGIFFAAAHSMFETWGKPSTPHESAVPQQNAGPALALPA
ncbi:MAG: hypothetical protein CTY39_07550 [Hyphomicrobium sp.]|nr:MAG: hypothetical protein CTY39_07550 [Hyphomicrobium sp.]